ncbi:MULTISPECIES: hypothetical protein [unclassified Lysobacter]
MNHPDNNRPPARNPDKHGPGRDEDADAGYAEPKPRDKHDARQPDPRRPPNPDEGGLGRKPETDPGAAGN